MDNQMLWLIIGIAILVLAIWYFMGREKEKTTHVTQPMHMSPHTQHDDIEHIGGDSQVEGYKSMNEMQMEINNTQPTFSGDLIDDVINDYQPPASGPSAVQKMNSLLDSYNVSMSNPMYEEMATMSYNPTPTSILLTPRLTETSISAAVQGDVPIAPAAPRDVFRPLYGRRDATNKSLFGCNKINLGGSRTADQIIVEQIQNPQVGIGPNIGMGGSADVLMN